MLSLQILFSIVKFEPTGTVLSGLRPAADRSSFCGFCRRICFANHPRSEALRREISGGRYSRSLIQHRLLIRRSRMKGRAQHDRRSVNKKADACLHAFGFFYCSFVLPPGLSRSQVPVTTPVFWFSFDSKENTFPRLPRNLPSSKTKKTCNECRS